MDFISCLEKELEIKAIKEFKDMQLGDVKETQAENKKIISWVGDYKETSLSKGIKNFVDWYKAYYG